MYLPGTPNERIGDLRTKIGLSQKELAEMIGVSASQLSRIENGETQSISSELLIKLAKAFGVSTDYILGITTISTPKSRDISELGLSEGAVKGLVNGAVDVQMLNHLMEHKTFSYLLYLIKTYFDNSLTAGIMTRNALIDMATATLGDFMKDNPEHKAEVVADAKYLRSQKLADNEAELEKIKSTFLAILKDIKKNIEDGNVPEQPATVEFLQTMREQIQAAQKEQKPVGVDDVVEAVMSMVGQVTQLDGESVDLFKQLAERVLSSGIQNNDVIQEKNDFQ